MKFLFTGDWHLRGNNPRNRIDDYQAAVNCKLIEICELAKQHDVVAILMPGDVWDRPEVSIGVLLHYAKLLNDNAPCDIICTIGNHDIYGYNLSTYERSSLKLLELLVPKLVVISDNDPALWYSDVVITASAYSGKMDIDGYGYGDDIIIDEKPAKAHIHIAHGMLLDHKPPFDRYTLIEDCKTRANIVLTGHDHTGYGVVRRSDGVVFCNPGAVMRMSASVTEIERPVQVALIDVTWQDLNIREWAVDTDIQLISLQSALPGDEVLDRSKIDEAKARQYAMDNFSTLIQSHTGGKAIVDVNQIVEAIAKQEDYAPEVVKTALEVLDRQREAMGTTV